MVEASQLEVSRRLKAWSQSLRFRRAELKMREKLRIDLGPKGARVVMKVSWWPVIDSTA